MSKRGNRVGRTQISFSQTADKLSAPNVTGRSIRYRSPDRSYPVSGYFMMLAHINGQAENSLGSVLVNFMFTQNLVSIVLCQFRRVKVRFA